MKTLALFGAVMAFFGAFATAPYINTKPNVVWHLTYVDERGDEWVQDILHNVGDCWAELRKLPNRKGYSCERTLIVRK